MPSQKKTVENYGFRDVHDRMDAHVARENKRPQTRRSQSGRNAKGQFDASGHIDVTAGARIKRGAPVVHPYGGTPYGTIERPMRAKEQWRRTIEEKRDQIGTRVARESSRARPGCALLVVRASEATALAFKLRAALKGGQVRDKRTKATGATLHEGRSRRVLAELAHAAETGETITLGVYTRGELKIIGAQRTHAKHITRHVRNLEAKLAGTRR